MSKTVVILGGAYAGLHIAHALLKNTKDVRVVLVSKNSHFYWNIASVRAIIPGLVPEEQIFGSLETALSRYPKERAELIIGSAEAVDVKAKTVKVVVAGGEEKTLSYDQLVLATGSRTAATDEVPWKSNGTYEDAIALLHKVQERVKAANHIVVAGAGSTGVEVAGELGFEYGGKKPEQGGKEVVLLSSGAQLLGGDSVAASAASELKKLHVAVRANARVVSTNQLPDGKTEVTLDGGDKILTDLYLPTMGLVPNTDYLDKAFLNERGNVVVDEFFRLRGAEDVWAAGDVVSLPRAGFMITQKQAAGVAKNIELTLKGKPPLPVKGLPVDIFAVCTGRSRGVGRMGSSVKLLSVMVWLAKGRTLGTQQLPSYVSGGIA